MFDDFDFDIDGLDLSFSRIPLGGEEQYIKTVLLSNGRVAEVKAEWSSLAGLYEISFETAYSMETTNAVFSVRDIRTIFRTIGELCWELSNSLDVKKFCCMPTCSKRRKVYSKFLKSYGFKVEDGPLMTFEIV